MAFEPPVERRSVHALQDIMRKLRAPVGGCPWDVEQTHRSIARYCLEEAYEVVDAIENGDDDAFCEELGDLLLQVVFHAQMAEERGAFTLDDIAEAVVNKMVRRHPHVFGDAAHRDADEQTQAWEEIKAAERQGQETEAVSALDNVPIGLPALTRAEKLGKRAARQGFDWPSTDGVIAKIREELDEVEQALALGDEAATADELGDLLFSVANLTRFLGVDGESALRGTNEKFSRRFRAIEDGVRSSGKAFKDHTLAELESYWDAEKARERGHDDK